jgi:hypothetical protein
MFNKANKSMHQYQIQTAYLCIKLFEHTLNQADFNQQLVRPVLLSTRVYEIKNKNRKTTWVTQ